MAIPVDIGGVAAAVAAAGVAAATAADAPSSPSAMVLERCSVHYQVSQVSKDVKGPYLNDVHICTGWGISLRTWVGLTWIWRVPRLVGRYCSYLLPKHDGGTFQIKVNPTQVRGEMPHPVVGRGYPKTR